MTPNYARRPVEREHEARQSNKRRMEFPLFGPDETYLDNAVVYASSLEEGHLLAQAEYERRFPKESTVGKVGLEVERVFVSQGLTLKQGDVFVVWTGDATPAARIKVVGLGVTHCVLKLLVDDEE